MKLSIIKTEVLSTDNQVSVILTCRPNLKWFENQFIHFDPKIIKKVLAKYVPTATIHNQNTSTYSAAPGITSTECVACTPTIDYNYWDCFVVRGDATCDPNDEFQFELGRQLAESRAKKAAYLKMKQLTSNLVKYLNKSIKELVVCRDHMGYMLNYERLHEDNLIHRKSE